MTVCRCNIIARGCTGRDTAAAAVLLLVWTPLLLEHAARWPCTACSLSGKKVVGSGQLAGQRPVKRLAKHLAKGLVKGWSKCWLRDPCRPHNRHMHVCFGLLLPPVWHALDTLGARVCCISMHWPPGLCAQTLAKRSMPIDKRLVKLGQCMVKASAMAAC